MTDTAMSSELRSSVTQYDGDVVRAGVIASVFWGMVGFMVGVLAALQLAWTGRLDSTTIKALTVYVHSLGGGE